MGNTTATAKYCIKLTYAKATIRSVAENINIGGATSGVQLIEALIPFYPAATVMGGAAGAARGIPSVIFTYTGATVNIPAGIATTGIVINMLVWGRSR